MGMFKINLKKKIKFKAKKPHAQSLRQGMSQIDAAVRVLSKLRKPMRLPDICAEIEKRGYWKTPTGKTPVQSLSSSVQREIKNHGRNSRFARVAPGVFELISTAPLPKRAKKKAEEKTSKEAANKTKNTKAVSKKSSKKKVKKVKRVKKVKPVSETVTHDDETFPVAEETVEETVEAVEESL